MGKPLEFDYRDSARREGKITYIAYPGEKVVITGGISIKGWERVKDSEIENLWRVHAPEVEYARQLFINGSSAMRPRTETVDATA